MNNSGVKIFLLHHGLRIDVFCQCQVVDNDLVLVVPIFQLDNVVRRRVLPLLRLLHDAERLHLLADLSLANELSQPFNFSLRFAQRLIQLRLVSWILFERLESCLQLVALPVQCLGVGICFLDLLFQHEVVVFTACIKLDASLLLR